ncbi:MAG: hypothetical protein ACI83P_001374 [Janthinobacterium sp.]|jgi:hypothetical protein
MKLARLLVLITVIASPVAYANDFPTIGTVCLTKTYDSSGQWYPDDAQSMGRINQGCRPAAAK